MKHLTTISIYYSIIDQLVERMTVNHDVTGSDPVDGVFSIYRKSREREMTIKQKAYKFRLYPNEE